MVYCTHCADYCPSIKDPDKGYICCGTCGKVLDQEIYTDEPNFVKDNSGQSRLAGSILTSIESGYSMSHQRTLDKGKDEISQIVNNLHVSGGDTIVKKALKYYELALDRNFTRGRRTTHVAAACLYIACRYVLGAVFLQLCQVLQLSDHPFVQKLIDPSLFIHRFTERLLGGRDNAVSDTALRIIASMKRDWMQAGTGRKPSGLCGAALYIAALSHGHNYTKADIVSVVHVCEATLTKRLIEFENTDAGSLTIEEFLATADECNQEPVPKCSLKPGEVLCKHKDNKGSVHFAHGLCEKCYNKFTKLSGGLEGGCDPPAFQRAEKQRLEAAKRAEDASAAKEAVLEESLCDTQNSDVENTITPSKLWGYDPCDPTLNGILTPYDPNPHNRDGVPWVMGQGIDPEFCDWCGRGSRRFPGLPRLPKDNSTNVVSRHMKGWRTGGQKALCQQKRPKTGKDRGMAAAWRQGLLSRDIGRHVGMRATFACRQQPSVVVKGIRGDKSSAVAFEEHTNDSILSKDPEGGGENCEGDADRESLSDIDDVEVDWYLHNEEETQYKKIIWEEMNKEYLEEQAAKEALAAELAARGGVVEEGKKKKRRRNEDTKSSKPAETPAEATYNMLKRKGLGSKVSAGAVGELYKTKDEDGSAHKKEEMDFDAQYGQDNADGETFDHGYYSYDGYDDDGTGVYNGIDDFDFN
ncbi:transcription factor IIIB 90 kDa subunit-like isoform X1 [Panicum miliaceum]|uniref:Transcription factor IIIB 90 kDa subunit-like isoform X1 n=1 Tax=Panicum miliaceum TaxID=4540 RepID=A0A3L6RKB5_PANMI|nr:transcription factor IIIB 90 kDa subunit-like isoform X1 [Panicum miliaceum]